MRLRRPPSPSASTHSRSTCYLGGRNPDQSPTRGVINARRTSSRAGARTSEKVGAMDLSGHHSNPRAPLEAFAQGRIQRWGHPSRGDRGQPNLRLRSSRRSGPRHASTTTTIIDAIAGGDRGGRSHAGSRPHAQPDAPGRTRCGGSGPGNPRRQSQGLALRFVRVRSRMLRHPPSSEPALDRRATADPSEAGANVRASVSDP